MQIKRLEIAGFGKFQQQQFEFGDGLQVIYGLNESGKSTMRAFILGMLFGFPPAVTHLNAMNHKVRISTVVRWS
ncbi:AAA family ATPase [Lactiplantibacillus plantarum]|nr:AAA family ATPase [Lactiplantibacillus plantarum]MDO7795042.1 AAA family ATPase [Lactiplantibacillus plantarum]